MNGYEEVNHPPHYNWHPVSECIAISEWFPANLAQAIQYIWRCGYKPGVDAHKDLDKAIWFLQREKQRLGEVAGIKKETVEVSQRTMMSNHFCRWEGAGLYICGWDDETGKTWAYLNTLDGAERFCRGWNIELPTAQGVNAYSRTVLP